MNKLVIIAAIILFLLVIGIIIYPNLTGKVVENSMKENSIPSFGPSQEEINCMKSCVSVGCDSGNLTCMQANSEKCQLECNVVKPEQTEEEKCVETCAMQGCNQYDFDCQKKNQEKCDKECGMVKEPEAKNEEELCIRNCVNSKAPGTRCQASQEGETGNEICKECAKSCEYLYNGPCLNDEKLKAKQKDCETCEHCYGEPVIGPSGEGWDCITSVECKDASSEFGDEPGTGEGISAKIGDTIGNIVESLGNFFSNLFSGEKENSEVPST